MILRPTQIRDRSKPPRLELVDSYASSAHHLLQLVADHGDDARADLVCSAMPKALDLLSLVCSSKNH